MMEQTGELDDLSISRCSLSLLTFPYKLCIKSLQRGKSSVRLMETGFPILELPIILRTPESKRQQTTLLQPPLRHRLAGSADGNYSLALSAELHGSFLSKGNWIMLECLRVLHQQPVRILSPLYSTSYPTPC